MKLEEFIVELPSDLIDETRDDYIELMCANAINLADDESDEWCIPAEWCAWPINSQEDWFIREFCVHRLSQGSLKPCPVCSNMETFP